MGDFFFGDNLWRKTESNPNFMGGKPCMLLQTLSNSVGDVHGLGVCVCVGAHVRKTQHFLKFKNFFFLCVEIIYLFFLVSGNQNPSKITSFFSIHFFEFF